MLIVWRSFTIVLHVIGMNSSEAALSDISEAVRPSYVALTYTAKAVCFGLWPKVWVKVYAARAANSDFITMHNISSYFAALSLAHIGRIVRL